MGIFPEIGVKITKYLSCHHLERCFPRVARHLTPLLLVDRDLELQDHLKTEDAEGSIQGVGEKPFLWKAMNGSKQLHPNTAYIVMFHWT